MNERMETASYLSFDLWHTQQVPNTHLLNPPDTVLTGRAYSNLIARPSPNPSEPPRCTQKQCHLPLTIRKVLIVVSTEP